MTDSIFETDTSDFDSLFLRFETNLKFKGNSIEEWSALLKVKNIDENFSLEDVERYTIKISNLTDTISNNYSLAYANYTGLKRSIERSMMIAKQSVLEEIEEHNKTATGADVRRKPTSDQLEVMAYNRTKDLQISFAISEIFYNFWKIQYDKIYLLNQRVTSLNVLKNIESKGVNLT